VRRLQASEEGLSISRAAILKGGELALCREASVSLYAVRTRPPSPQPLRAPPGTVSKEQRNFAVRAEGFALPRAAI
jgi:hypothetical protein